jgi:hypothetical protein
MVGASGRVPERVLLVTASACNFPSLMCGDTTAGELKPIGVCSPDHRHHRWTGAAERNVGERSGSALSLVSAGLGISCIPSLLQRMSMDGVIDRRRKGARATKGPAEPRLAPRRSVGGGPTVPGDRAESCSRFCPTLKQLATGWAGMPALG